LDLFELFDEVKGQSPTYEISRKTKKLWSGQASLRRSGRSGRKNQTKSMSPFVGRGDIIITYFSEITPNLHV
jgi:hypothetical protein